MKEALDGLAVSLDEEGSGAVDLSSAVTLESWTRSVRYFMLRVIWPISLRS